MNQLCLFFSRFTKTYGYLRMKKILLLSYLFLVSYLSFAQDNYTVNGENIMLKTEVEGHLDLLWNIINSEYRYFVRTPEGNIIELKNTKGDDNRYKDDYKVTLEELTKDENLSARKVKLTLPSLRTFLDDYNRLKDENYQSYFVKSTVGVRMGLSAGITNNPFVGNPDNIKTPLVGAELEFFEGGSSAKHAGILQIRQIFRSDDFDYSLTEFSLGYRYRFLNFEKLNIYGQVRVATFGFSNVTITDSSNMEQTLKETSFDVPFIFGIGADFKVSERSYITFIYGELFAALLDNQGNFSTDISVGYKFRL